ncbi:MAG: SAM-dependent methyltransferase [Acidobacteria bacterium]|nr:MAG: SAM-dependent methyltransferase [Acidobacteriota bacterium]
MNSAKCAVQTYWNSRPCGSGESPNESTPAEFFRTYTRIRYEREPEIMPFAEFRHWVGQCVLEIGVGIGADYVQFLRAGAKAVGLDLSLRSLELARQNAATNKVAANFLNADAECLPFADETFDLVYSWGVLHHSPDVARTLQEIHRVLRPGDECRAMLYHRHSLVALQCYLRYGLGSLRPFTPLSDLIAANIESPGTKAFTCREARFLFRGFREIKIRPVVTVYDLRLRRRRFAPRWMLRMVPSRLGWFLLIRVLK